MALIVPKRTEEREVMIMSNGKKYWLTFTNAGQWEVYVNLTPQQATRLNREFGIDLHVDDGMSNPDE